MDNYNLSNENGITNIIDGYNVIEYSKYNIYIIEDIIDDIFCEKKIELINRLPLWKASDGNIKHVNCYMAFIRELLKVDDDFYYLFDLLPDNTIKNEQSTKFINDKMIITNDLNGITKENIKNINDEITTKMKIINKIINKINKYLNLEFNVGYNFKKIYNNTTEHIDGLIYIYNSDIIFNDVKEKNYNMIRNASIIFNLNDNYEGGVFVFPRQDISFKLKKGSVLIFPPYWTHPHYVTKTEDNTFRYTISTFTCEKVNPFHNFFNK